MIYPQTCSPITKEFARTVLETRTLSDFPDFRDIWRLLRLFLTILSRRVRLCLRLLLCISGLGVWLRKILTKSLKAHKVEVRKISRSVAYPLGGILEIAFIRFCKSLTTVDPVLFPIDVASPLSPLHKLY